MAGPENAESVPGCRAHEPVSVQKADMDHLFLLYLFIYLEFLFDRDCV